MSDIPENDVVLGPDGWPLKKDVSPAIPAVESEKIRLMKLNNSKVGREFRRQSEGSSKSRKERTAEWRTQNPEKYREYMRVYMSNRRKATKHYHLEEGK